MDGWTIKFTYEHLIQNLSTKCDKTPKQKQSLISLVIEKWFPKLLHHLSQEGCREANLCFPLLLELIYFLFPETLF